MNNSERCHSTEWRTTFITPLLGSAVGGSMLHPTLPLHHSKNVKLYSTAYHLISFSPPSYSPDRAPTVGEMLTGTYNSGRLVGLSRYVFWLIKFVSLTIGWVEMAKIFCFYFFFSEHKRVWGLVWIVQEVEQLQYWWYKLIDFFFFVKFDIGFILLGVEQICCGLQINLFIIVFVSIWNSW